ncbi:hypothetical protein [Deinococcus arenicola]|uniref:Uncharacterized protein n=1 Tax=Deinococcus arenicola TaxID=2994950 RepID=A0ABU4DQD8_9DEIO|nr:hypothetical protein [Deinococcus sp. ZS9-10]MDV6374646.1 hypothetical protein [Deinococcus sp. ZS9-10]
MSGDTRGTGLNDTSPLIDIHDEDDTSIPEEMEERRSFSSVLLGTASEGGQPEKRPNPGAQDTTEN